MNFIKLPNGSYIRIDQIIAVRVHAAIGGVPETRLPDRVMVDLDSHRYERCDCASAKDAERLADWIVDKIS